MRKLSATRRAFLKQSTLGALGCALGCAARDENPEALSKQGVVGLFPWGAVCGDVRPDGASFVTRYWGDELLELQIREMRTGRLAWKESCHADAQGFVYRRVRGLAAGRSYRYVFRPIRFGRDDLFGSTPEGYFNTFAGVASAPEVFRLAAFSCSKNGLEFPILERAAAMRFRDGSGAIDAALLLGDTCYNDGVSHNLDAMRSRWAQNLGGPGYQALARRMPIYATYDDHEARDNADPEGTDFSPIWRALFEHLPIERIGAQPASEARQIWRSFRLTRHVDLFRLDCRGERRPSTRGQPEEQYISQAQMDALKGWLLESDATFKVIMNSVPIAELPGPTALGPMRSLPGVYTDRWQGYARQRDDILSFIEGSNPLRRLIPGVLWISGDVHFGSVIRRISSGGAPGSRSVEITVGPTAQDELLLLRQAYVQTLNWSLFDRRFEWADARNNFALLTFRPIEGYVEVEHYGEGEFEILHRTAVFPV